MALVYLQGYLAHKKTLNPRSTIAPYCRLLVGPPCVKQDPSVEYSSAARGVQGYLAHKKTPTPYGRHRALGIGLL